MVGPEGYGRGWGQTSLGDMPESCVAAVLLYLDPLEICQVACLNRAFRGAASADCIWAAKLPANHRYLAALAAAAGGGEGRRRAAPTWPEASPSPQTNVHSDATAAATGGARTATI